MKDIKDIPVNYRFIPSTVENIKEVEKVRYNAYGYSFTCENNCFVEAILDGKIIMFGCYIFDELVGGCYVSNSNQSLYI